MSTDEMTNADISAMWAQLAKVTGERDRARDLAAALEAELAAKVTYRSGAVTASGWMNFTQSSDRGPS